jgi:hypothetical protein
MQQVEGMLAGGTKFGPYEILSPVGAGAIRRGVESSLTAEYRTLHGIQLSLADQEAPES